MAPAPGHTSTLLRDLRNPDTGTNKKDKINLLWVSNMCFCIMVSPITALEWACLASSKSGLKVGIKTWIWYIDRVDAGNSAL